MKEIEIEGVVEIPQCGLYTKTPKSLKALKGYLKEEGYKIKDCRKDKDRPAVEVQEEKGWYLWYAHLSDKALQRKGKCRSCKSLIEDRGIQVHNHKCEACGKPTWVEYQDGTLVGFSIMDNPNFFEDLTLVVHSYDEKNKLLNFYKDPQKSKLDDWGDKVALSYGRLPEMLDRFPLVFMEQEIDGVKVFSTYHDTGTFFLNREKDKINIGDVSGKKCNFDIVRIFKGKEYSEYERLPVPESYELYEAWHWAPLKPSPTLHEKIIHAAGMVSDCGYYYQDGRPEFHEIHLERMRRFVDNFTTLNIKKWDSMIVEADKSGPGMVRAVARFCHPAAVAENRPNIGNTMVAICKASEGKVLTQQEIEAAEAGQFAENSEVLEEVLGHMAKEAEEEQTTPKPRVLSKKKQSKILREKIDP